VFRIVLFEPRYRDDAIFCVLAGKDALGRVPNLNEDLLDIQKNYLDPGDMFWVALDENDRVIGTLGVQTVSPADMWLRRLFIKPQNKRTGVGSALFSYAEAFARSKNICTIHTKFAYDYSEAAQFYPSQGFVEVEPCDGCRHFVKHL